MAACLSPGARPCRSTDGASGKRRTRGRLPGRRGARRGARRRRGAPTRRTDGNRAARIRRWGSTTAVEHEHAGPRGGGAASAGDHGAMLRERRHAWAETGVLAQWRRRFPAVPVTRSRRPPARSAWRTRRPHRTRPAARARRGVTPATSPGGRPPPWASRPPCGRPRKEDRGQGQGTPRRALLRGRGQGRPERPTPSRPPGPGERRRHGRGRPPAPRPDPGPLITHGPRSSGPGAGCRARQRPRHVAPEPSRRGPSASRLVRSAVAAAWLRLPAAGSLSAVAARVRERDRDADRSCGPPPQPSADGRSTATASPAVMNCQAAAVRKTLGLRPRWRLNAALKPKASA